ncbi:hypothetical protein SPBRAN_2073 [uncultured Candidatus Thioglobus sp.]|nr:hypothetical protein SPBRAN_2073 [uncultured Candidatus Thioglobus sp.]
MIYVIVQFSCIIYLIFNAKFEFLDTTSIALLSVAVVIGLLAVFNMKINNLNIVPSLKENHQLVVNGIYRYIRHPMYTSVIFLCLSLMLTNVHLYAQLATLVLFIDLILKSNVEEKLLTERFSNYVEYKNTTGRFLPFIKL